MPTKTEPHSSKRQNSSLHTGNGIAIIGLSGRFPGGANSPDLLWNTLRSGQDAVGELQGDRWDLGWHNPDKERVGRVYTRSCGTLEQIDGFDAEFFGISPREAKQMDPQHRLLLELAWEAFENAGIPPRSVSGSSTGVYVGISSTDYSSLLNSGWPNAYSNTGSALSIAANRISYIFDLHGPSLAVDTACSSSLVGIHQACQAILRGECTSALAGGVNILADIGPWLGFARASMLSPTGRCKAFDESGDGYVRAEGGALVLLKRLEDAERDRNEILGVILGTGINSDGRTMGLAMPNGDAQEALLRQVYNACGVAPEQVYYVEAHGTGTSVGDPIECGALGRVLGQPRSDGSRCRIGSVKSNIGHLEPASGVAGLAKVLLSLRHGEIPANLHFQNPNPKIRFEDWKLEVVDRPIPLPQQDEPLIFGINSFGFGGTNAHLVLSQYRGPAREEAAPPTEAPFLILSAHCESALRKLAEDYVQILQAPDVNWNALAAATALARSPQRLRLVVCASSAPEAAHKLNRWLEGHIEGGTALGTTTTEKTPTAFIYSGNGPQWWGMGRELLANNEIFRQEVSTIDAIFTPLAGWSLIAEMQRSEGESRMHLTEVAQPMLFAMQMGLTAVMRQAGIFPHATAGHSVGEVAAACASGALTLEEATSVIYYRSREQAKTLGMGKLAALGVAAEVAEELIGTFEGWLELAAINGPEAVTVAGDEAMLTQLVERVTASGKFARLLQLDYPFHTKAMDTIQEPLLSALSNLCPSPCTVPFISTVKGGEHSGEELDAQYWFRNVREPVRFYQAIRELVTKHEVSLFIEIGPHPVLKDYILQTLRATGASGGAIPTLRRPKENKPESDVENLSSAVVAAHANGASHAATLFERPSPLPKLPNYPWQRERLWRGGVVLPDNVTPITKVHPLLGSQTPANDGIWSNPIDKHHLAFLQDHVVQNAVLFPAAGYVEMALAAAQERLTHEVLDIENFQILRPLVLPEHEDPIVQTIVNAQDGSTEISSRRDRDGQDFTTHVRCRISHAEHVDAPRFDIASIIARTPHVVSSSTHYTDANQRGLQYGPLFQGIQSIRLSNPDAKVRECLAHIELGYLEDEAKLRAYRSHPALFDSSLQAVISLCVQLDKRNISTIPVQFERVRSYQALTPKLLCYALIKSESDRSIVVDLHMLAPDGTVLLSVENGRCQKANLSGNRATSLISEWWRPDPQHASAAKLPPLVSPKDLVTHLSAATDAIATADASTVQAKLNHLATLYVIQTLDQLRPEAPNFTMAQFCRQARIGREGSAFLAQLLKLAEAAGKIRRDGDGWIWDTSDTFEDPDKLWAKLFGDYPQWQAELLLLCTAKETLVARLTKPKNQAVNTNWLNQLEDTSPLSSTSHQLMMEAIQKLVTEWPKDRPIRILELHGGFGGMASWLLPLLPGERTDYVFTDPDDAWVAKATRRFSSYPFVRCMGLQQGDDLQALGLGAHYFDVVLLSGRASEGKGAGKLLEDIQPCLADDAYVLSTGPLLGPLGDVLTGSRQELSPAALTDMGFGETESIVLSSPLTTCSLASLTIARYSASRSVELPRPASESKHFLVVTQQPETFALYVASALNDVGQQASVAALSEKDTATDELVKLLSSKRPSHVILLSSKQGQDNPFAGQETECLGAIALVKALNKAREDFDCHFRIVTRGAFPNGLGHSPLDPSEAALWGLGRVIANENAHLQLRLIDLHTPKENREQARWLAAELLRQDDETEVQLSFGHRYVQRERLNSLSDEARMARQATDAFALDFVPQGGIESIYLRALERKEPGPSDVEIEVKAAGLNFRDVLWTMGMLPEEAVEHGFSGPTIGMECAGRVVRVGSNVVDLAPGDRVVAFASSCFGSHVTTEAMSVAKIPNELDYPAAATIPTAFLTAWYGLDYLARLRKGETILIHGAAGGVGLAAIQIAKLKGAKIIGTAGTTEKRRMLELLGVDVALNSRTLAFADKVMELTDGKGVDVILNSLAGEAITKNLQCLRPFGRFLEIGKRDFYANSRIGLRPFRNNLSYFGIDADTLLIERASLAQQLFSEVMQQFAAGRLQPLPHQVVPVARASEAFRTMQQSRHVGKLVVSMSNSTDLPVVSTKSPVRRDVTYLITGGLGGFGLQTAYWLAEQGANSLALVSRSGASNAEAQEGISKLQARGISVRAFAADVSDAQDLSQVLHQVRKEMPPLAGVIHSAAVIEDAPILNIEKEQLRRVFLPKIMGAWNLHQLTQVDNIDMFILYSSVSSVVGNPGQGAYVAANLYLDALALQRRALGLPALSIGWGAIQDAGFLTRNKNVADLLKGRAGLDAIPAREALADLTRITALGSTRVSVASFDLHRLHKMLPAAQSPRFLPIVPKDASVHLQAEETLVELLAAMPEAERQPFIVNRIVENTAQVLGTSASHVSAQQPLSELGLDSLMAVELAGLIERDIGQTVPVMQLIGADSLNTVADFVARALGVTNENKTSSSTRNTNQQASVPSTETQPRS